MDESLDHLRSSTLLSPKVSEIFRSTKALVLAFDATLWLSELLSLRMTNPSIEDPIDEPLPKTILSHSSLLIFEDSRIDESGSPPRTLCETLEPLPRTFHDHWIEATEGIELLGEGSLSLTTMRLMIEDSPTHEGTLLLIDVVT